MLRQRIITACVLLVLVLGAVFGLPASYFMVFIGLVIGLAIWEWSALTGLVSPAARWAYLLAMAALMFIGLHAPVLLLLVPGLCFWVAALVLVFAYPAGIGLWGNRTLLGLLGLPLLLPGWAAFVFLREQDHYAFHLLFLPALVAAADIGAFFAGRTFGSRKLAVRVSPNKTWEGFAGGLLACIFLSILTGLVFIKPAEGSGAMPWLKLSASALLVAAVSVVGDLFESMVKRFRDVKDSGTLLPGHGGILDRIDGLTAASPFYAVLVILLAPGLT